MEFNGNEFIKDTEKHINNYEIKRYDIKTSDVITFFITIVLMYIFFVCVLSIY